MLKIAYKVVEMTELWSKVSYLDEKVKKNFFGPKPLKTRLSPKLLEIERSKSVFRLLACFSTKMLKIAYKVVEMTELWSKVSYLDEKVKKKFFWSKTVYLKTRLSPKLLEIERSKSVFRLLACFSTKMLKIAYKVVEMTELWSKVSYLDEKVKKNFFLVQNR